MKPQCINAVEAAAGRKLSKGELDAIEESVVSSMKELSRTDSGFQALSKEEKYAAAVKLSKERMLEAVVRNHENAVTEAGRKAQLMADVSSVKPGAKGQTHHVYQKIMSLDWQQRALADNIVRQIEGADRVAGGKFLGLIQDPAQSFELVKAKYGEDVSPEVKKAWDSYEGATRKMAEQYQRAGIPLHILDDWGFSQNQDPHRVAGVTQAEYVDLIADTQDRNAFLNEDGSRMNDEDFRTVLGEIYQTHVTGGANKRLKSPSEGGKAWIGGGKNRPRQLHFKDAASWFKVMDRFGETTNVYSLVNESINSMAKDMAIVEVFGRDADNNIKQALDLAFSNDAPVVGEKGRNKLESLKKTTQQAFDVFAHPLKPRNEVWANRHSQIRSYLGAVMLGNPATAVPDIATAKLAAEVSGIPAVTLMGHVMRSTIPQGERKVAAHRMGLFMEGFRRVAEQTAKRDIGSKFGGLLYETNHTISGLAALDKGYRQGTGLAVMDVLGSAVDKHATAAEAMKGTPFLEKVGITDDVYSVWKTAGKEQVEGFGAMLTPDAVYAIPDENLVPLAEARIKERSKVFEAEIEKRRARDAQEQAWLDTKSTKMDERRAAAKARIDALLEKGTAKADEAAFGAGLQAELLGLSLQRLEAAHDLTAARATEAAGAALEKKPGRTKGGLTSKTLNDYGRAINQGGEGLGKVQAELKAKIDEMTAKVKELYSDVESKVDAAEKQAAKDSLRMAEELDVQAREFEERAAKRADYIAAYEAKVGGLLGEETARLKDEAAVALMNTVNQTRHFISRGAEHTSFKERFEMGIANPEDAGTFWGEAKRYALQFKAVPLGVFKAHIEQMKTMPHISKGAVWGSKEAYAARYVAYTMLMGAVALEIKSLFNGQNPRSMDPSSKEGYKFWLESIAAGGGYGIYGDILLNGQSKGGAGLEAFMGPGAGAAVDAIKEARMAMDDAAPGKTSKHKYALSALRWTRRNATPLGNLWYSKAAFNRLVYDNLQDLLVPGTSARLTRAAEKRGATYWWKPGTNAPQSAPDLSSAVE